MPMRYADQATVLAHLKIADSDTAKIARVVAVENGLAETFDGLVGRSFGPQAATETRTVPAYDTDVLVLTDGIRVIQDVAIDGDWDGAGWDGETVLDAGAYRPWPVDRDGVAYGLVLIDGVWTGLVRVTGQWADQPGGDVPADVVLALNTLTIKEYRRQTSSPLDQVGPDGAIVSTPSGWNDPEVKAVVARHRVVRLVV